MKEKYNLQNNSNLYNKSETTLLAPPLNNKNRNDNNNQNNRNNLHIVNYYNKNNLKLIPLNARKFELGQVKYFPPVSKEWTNSIYTFNLNKLKNLPLDDLKTNYLIKSYFNSFFHHLFIHNRYKPGRFRRLSMNKIYVSKAEIKHTNSKAIFTIYTYNREKISLLKKIKTIIKITKWKKRKINFFKKSLRFYRKIYRILNRLMDNSNKNLKILAQASYLGKIFKKIFVEQLRLFRKYKLRLNLNKYKFEEKILYLLTSLISKYYNKKIEFNIVNMKALILNSDIFTKILTLKIKNKKAHIIRLMNFLLNKAVLPRVNRILEKGSVKKSVDFNLLENKYLNTTLTSILTSNSEGTLDELLNKRYLNVSLTNYGASKLSSKKKLHEILFNSIKYKNMGGIRFEIKGRLTKRYRADRALYKVKWKGGLKNIDSSYKGLSSINKRGYLNPNVEYSIFTSKRRIGSFAVKGWIGGK
jgi:hypothetical protein